jgi:hypothetical protein
MNVKERSSQYGASENEGSGQSPGKGGVKHFEWRSRYACHLPPPARSGDSTWRILVRLAESLSPRPQGMGDVIARRNQHRI